MCLFNAHQWIVSKANISRALIAAFSQQHHLAKGVQWFVWGVAPAMGQSCWLNQHTEFRHTGLIFPRWHLATAHIHMYVNLELQEAWNVVVLSQVFFCQVKIFKDLLLTLFWINSFQWSKFVAGCQVTAVSLLYLSLWNKSCELLSLNDFIVCE